MRPTTISNKNLIFRIVLIVLVISVLVLFISTEYLKKTAINTLASDDAKKTAQLVFETMNTRMQEGWTKQDLDKIIKRLQIVRKGMVIDSYRSPQVEELFGVIPEVKKKVESDPLIVKAMNGEEVFYVDEETGIVRFLYPMKTSTECNHCHVNATTGSINGVLDISFPQSDIKISLDSITFYLILFFVIFLLILSYVFYITINKKMVEPIVNLTHNIKTIEQSKDLTKQVKMSTNIEELNILQKSFNKLLLTIKFYYDKLIESIYTDKLTNTYNLTKIHEDIDNFTSNKGSLIVLDLKSLGMINRVYGHKVADDLLIQFSSHIKSNIDENDLFYRLYGDEFAILSKENTDHAKIMKLKKDLLKNTFEYKESEFTLDVTLGYVNKINDVSLEHAILALRYAKTKKLDYYEYDNTLAVKDEDNNHIDWLKRLEFALDNDQIVPYFMPMKNTKTGKIDKYEALLRIVDGDKVYTPDLFLDIALASGKYGQLTQTMIKKVFEYFKDIDDIKFSINLSLSDITNKNTTGILFDSLESYPYSENVVIELLETEEISDFYLLNKFIKKVKQYNAQVAIDDFGSGYSNFNYILNLDVDIVKLDSTLIENIFTDQNALVVVSNIVRISKEINLSVVAEKVKDAQIENILTIHEVDYLQGFHIGKPQKDILK